MRADRLWRSFVKRLDIENGVCPDAYEIYDGKVIFWFEDPSATRELVKRLRGKIKCDILWDREEGLMGIAVPRELL